MRWQKRTETWVGLGKLITNLLWPAKATSRYVITANAHASVWSREQAAVFPRIIFLN